MVKRKTNILFCAMVIILSILILGSIQKTDAAEIQPMFDNFISAFTNAQVSSSGNLEIVNTYTGSPGITTRVVMTTYIEKRVLGLFWNRVDIGVSNNQWVDTSYEDNYYSKRYNFQLTSTGTYRVTATYDFYGSSSNPETINKSVIVTY